MDPTNPKVILKVLVCLSVCLSICQIFSENADARDLIYVKANSRKSVRWSAVPVAPKLVYGRGGGERGSGPEGADDLCWARS